MKVRTARRRRKEKRKDPNLSVSTPPLRGQGVYWGGGGGGAVEPGPPPSGGAGPAACLGEAHAASAAAPGTVGTPDGDGGGDIAAPVPPQTGVTPWAPG